MQKQALFLKPRDIQAWECNSCVFTSDKPKVSITKSFQRQTLSPSKKSQSKKIPRFPNLQSPVPQLPKSQAGPARLVSEETLQKDFELMRRPNFCANPASTKRQAGNYYTKNMKKVFTKRPRHFQVDEHWTCTSPDKISNLRSPTKDSVDRDYEDSTPGLKFSSDDFRGTPALKKNLVFATFDEEFDRKVKKLTRVPDDSKKPMHEASRIDLA